MIFTECPSCNEPQAFSYECGDKMGWMPSRCGHCLKVMWVERTSMGGVTRDHESFLAEVANTEDHAEVNAAANRAKDLSVMEEA